MILGRARVILLAALLLAGAALAQRPVPALTGHVVDEVGMLAADRRAALDQRLAGYEARKGSQVAVLIVATTAPESIEQFSIRVAEQWKLGRRKVDDGAILLVARDDHALRIEVGYGLEGVLTDATSHRIIDEAIVPRFRAQDFAGGIEAGVDRILSVIDGEPLPPPAPSPRGEGGLPSFFPGLAILVVVLAGVLPALLGRLAGAVATGAIAGGAAWFLSGTLTGAVLAGVVGMMFTLLGGLGLLGMLGGGRRGSGWGGGGGAGGGGGFGGGGGGFGGGGASGRW